MAWIKQKKDEHVCPKPRLDGLVEPSPGDVWQCDHCDQQWIVQEHQIDGLYWLQTSGWRGLRER